MTRVIPCSFCVFFWNMLRVCKCNSVCVCVFGGIKPVCRNTWVLGLDTPWAQDPEPGLENEVTVSLARCRKPSSSDSRIIPEAGSPCGKESWREFKGICLQLLSFPLYLSLQFFSYCPCTITFLSLYKGKSHFSSFLTFIMVHCPKM